MGALSRWLTPPRRSLVAAAVVVSDVPDTRRTGLTNVLPSRQAWQDEVWGYYDSLGMFRNAVTWKSDMLSRVRLRAAKKSPDQDEPEILSSGPEADLVAQLTVDVQSQIMSCLAVHLSVPGEGFVIGEQNADGVNRWVARSADEIRESRAGSAASQARFEVLDDSGIGNTADWRPLSDESLVVRVWRPHKRFRHMADSNAKSARDSMRELELANRRVTAQYLSRIASAGVILFPQEVSFPVRDEFADAADPFMAEWVEIAATAIATQGSAAATVPMPMRMPGEWIDKVKHIDFTTSDDAQLVSKREQAQKQLAVDLDVPPEALLGLADANHWTGWLIEESGFKIYLAPDTETICGALTVGFLHPMLKSMGLPTEDMVIWYDASEITQRPDKSDNAKEAYLRGEITGEVFRRELGFDEADKPNDAEVEQIVLLRAALQPGTFEASFQTLTGKELVKPEPGPIPPGLAPYVGAPPPADEMMMPPEDKQNGPPDTPAEPPSADETGPAKKAAANRTRKLHQASLMHALRVTPVALQVLHPHDCGPHVFSCPVTHATWGDALASRPGTPGVYECWLTLDGAPRMGKMLMDAQVDELIVGVERVP